MNIAERIKSVEKKFVRSDLPKFDIGDTLKMKLKVLETDEKVRLHPFEGTVIRKSGTGIKSTFTVRKVSFGEGVERTFPLHSPVIDSIKIVSKGKTKRAKLYYLRRRVGKGARVRLEEAEQTVAIQQPQPQEQVSQ